MKLLSSALAVALASFCGWASAGNILIGTVSFDSSTRLFTYSYTIDNTSGLSVIDNLDILIDTSTTEGPHVPAASDYGSPTEGDWYFGRAQSGSIEDPPYNMRGTFWQWGAQNGYFIEPGESLSGFFFRTAYAPTTATTNNYFLYGRSIVEYGHVVAPNFGLPNPIPLPASLHLILAGLAGVFWVARSVRTRSA